MAVKSKAESKSGGEIFQILVTLLGTDPPIWRRVLAPADLTLARFHDVLQRVMGWEYSHMHEFDFGRQRYGEPDPFESGSGLGETLDEGKVRLSEVLRRAGAKGIYTYDFGDGWEHEILLEKRLPADPKQAYPVCVAGERACPPEDCGGIPGFYDLLEAIENPDHPQHDELLDWLGGGYDPQAFSIEAVNRALRPGRRPRPA
jgi:hypothetical protein